jgi:hypothetical protein
MGMFQTFNVNRKTTNIVVMSELGRYPIYFSVILAMLKYCHRLERQQVYYLMLIYVIKSYILVKSIHGIRVRMYFNFFTCDCSVWLVEKKNSKQ